jgi:hypothetical protein
MNLKLHSLTNLQLISLVERLDRELTEIRVKDAERGVGSELIRTPENYKVINDVLTKFKKVPFKMFEIFNQWLIDSNQIDNSDYVTKNLKHHFALLLIQNKYVVQVGGNKRSALFRVSDGYADELKNATELYFKCPSTQYNGTYLHARV